MTSRIKNLMKIKSETNLKNKKNMQYYSVQRMIRMFIIALENESTDGMMKDFFCTFCSAFVMHMEELSK